MNKFLTSPAHNLVKSHVVHVPTRQSVHPVIRVCTTFSSKAGGADSLKALKPQGDGAKYFASDTAYTAASDYLKEIGVNNLAEISRVLDIAMNPNSLFLSKTKNANARPLDVEKDMKPVIDFLVARHVQVGDIVKIVTGHPPVLSYTQTQLEDFWSYMESIGVKDVGVMISNRPNLLGLDVNNNLKKIVEYLQYIETPSESIIQLLAKSI